MVAAPAAVSPFTCVPDAILRNAQVSCEARLLYSILLSYRNRATGQCNPSLSTLAADLGCSERTTQRALASLLDAGWLTRQPDQAPRAPWLYAFPTLRGATPVTPSRGDAPVTPSPRGDTPVTPKVVRGDNPDVRGDKPDPFEVTSVTPLYKDEPDDRTRVTEPERAVVPAMARAREATPPQLGKAGGEVVPAGGRGTDQLRWVVGLAGRDMDDRWAEFEPLLLPPVLRFGLDASDPTLRKDIQTLATQLHTLVKESGVPREELVRWQIWQMGDPWWTTARYKYNPQRAWEQSWQIWKREGQPGTFLPRTPPTRHPAGPAIPTRGPTPGDPTVYGHGHVRWATPITEEQLAALNYSESLGRSSPVLEQMQTPGLPQRLLT